MSVPSPHPGAATVERSLLIRAEQIRAQFRVMPGAFVGSALVATVVVGNAVRPIQPERAAAVVARGLLAVAGALCSVALVQERQPGHLEDEALGTLCDCRGRYLRCAVGNRRHRAARPHEPVPPAVRAGGDDRTGFYLNLHDRAVAAGFSVVRVPELSVDRPFPFCWMAIGSTSRSASPRCCCCRSSYSLPTGSPVRSSSQ